MNVHHHITHSITMKSPEKITTKNPRWVDPSVCPPSPKGGPRVGSLGPRVPGSQVLLSYPGLLPLGRHRPGRSRSTAGRCHRHRGGGAAAGGWCPVSRAFTGLNEDAKMGLGQAFCSHSLGIAVYKFSTFR